jgi:hypothetical protein
LEAATLRRQEEEAAALRAKSIAVGLTVVRAMSKFVGSRARRGIRLKVNTFAPEIVINRRAEGSRACIKLCIILCSLRACARMVGDEG